MQIFRPNIKNHEETGMEESNPRRTFLKQAGMGAALAAPTALAVAAAAKPIDIPGAPPPPLPMPVEYTGMAGPEAFGPGNVVTYESKDRIALIRINRAAQRNTINAEVTDRLHDAWLHFNASDDRVAVLTSEGNDAFCSGGDHWKRAEDVWWCFPGVGVAVEKPIVCATAGNVIGTGLGLAIFCDLIIAAENSMFSYPEAKAGVGGGVTASLAARIPQKVAMEMLLIGDPVDARRAYEVGLVNKVVPVGKQVEVAMEYARKLAANAPRAVTMFKRFVNETVPRSPAEQAGITRRQISDVIYSKDRKEFFKAREEGRKPTFTGE
jgi:enoyl-CoA hydratase